MSEYDAKTICRKHEWTWKTDYPERGIFCAYCGRPNKRVCAARFQDRHDQPSICLLPKEHGDWHLGETILRGLGNVRIMATERKESWPL